jgi:hypothetical protein
MHVALVNRVSALAPGKREAKAALTAALTVGVVNGLANDILRMPCFGGDLGGLPASALALVGGGGGGALTASLYDVVGLGGSTVSDRSLSIALFTTC